ncbi:MAG TPA: aromatic amino acid lyase, partial [Pyrinomonadaceae bacterium]|jgi:histidine ammonia-lyase|nr:aromatic amino acid lyase [Pyrinomonadaceae bacterium]
MGATSAIKLRQLVENLELIIALEMFCAAQGIDFRKKSAGRDLKLGEGTRGVYEQIRKFVPFIEKDAYLKDHIDAVTAIVKDASLHGVNRSVENDE